MVDDDDDDIGGGDAFGDYDDTEDPSITQTDVFTLNSNVFPLLSCDISICATLIRFSIFGLFPLLDVCLPLSSCAKLAYVPFGQNKSDRHMFHIEIFFALRIIIHEADDEVQ